MIAIKVSQEDIERAVNLMRELRRDAKTITARSLNEAASQTRTQTVQMVREDLRLTSKYLKSKIHGPKDSKANKASSSRLQSAITADKKGLRLANFLSGKQPGIGQVKPPPKVKVKPAGSAKKITGGFLLSLKNTNDGSSNPLLGIFVRENKRLKQLYGPSASQAFDRERAFLIKYGAGVLTVQMGKNIDAAFRGYG